MYYGRLKYVKDGGVIPMIPAVLQAPKSGEILPLELRHYGEAEGSISWYDDDGERKPGIRRTYQTISSCILFFKPL